MNCARNLEARYQLTLFIGGTQVHSAQALQTVIGFCEEHLQGEYDLKVVDIFKHPELAEREKVVVVPTLIWQHHGPEKRFVGPLLSDRMQLLARLGFPSAQESV